MSHGHDWSPWVWDAWVLQSCWRRSCRTRGCYANEATLDITVAIPSIVIDHEVEWRSPDGDVEYSPGFNPQTGLFLGEMP